MSCAIFSQASLGKELEDIHVLLAHNQHHRQDALDKSTYRWALHAITKLELYIAPTTRRGIKGIISRFNTLKI